MKFKVLSIVMKANKKLKYIITREAILASREKEIIHIKITNRIQKINIEFRGIPIKFVLSDNVISKLVPSFKLCIYDFSFNKFKFHN